MSILKFRSLSTVLFSVEIQVKIHAPVFSYDIPLVGAFLCIVPAYRLTAGIQVILLTVIHPVADAHPQLIDRMLHIGQ